MTARIVGVLLPLGGRGSRRAGFLPSGGPGSCRAGRNPSQGCMVWPAESFPTDITRRTEFESVQLNRPSCLLRSVRSTANGGSRPQRPTGYFVIYGPKQRLGVSDGTYSCRTICTYLQRRERRLFRWTTGYGTGSRSLRRGTESRAIDGKVIIGTHGFDAVKAMMPSGNT